MSCAAPRAEVNHRTRQDEETLRERRRKESQIEQKAGHVSPKIEPLPLPGSVHAEYSRCSRPGCRCARGALHGPYYRRFWRESGRTRSAYVRLADVADVTAGCARYRRLHPSGRAFRRMARQFDALSAAVITAAFAALRGDDEEAPAALRDMGGPHD